MGMNTAAVQRLYVAYFNRPADPLAIGDYEAMLPADREATQAELQELAEKFFSPSLEYQAKIDGLGNADIVNQLYLNIFGRAADIDGLKGWTAALNAGTETVASLALQLSYSAQGTDATVVAARIEAATAFTNGLDTAEEILGYQGPAALAAATAYLEQISGALPTTDEAITAQKTAAVENVDITIAGVVAVGGPEGEAYTLKLTGDIITGTNKNDTINGTLITDATDSTLQASDSIDGGDGKDTLAIVQTGAATFPLATMTNVENVTVRAGTGNASINVAAYADVELLASTQSQNATLQASATADISAKGADGNIAIEGGKDVVAVNTNAAAADTITVGNTTAAAGNVTVTNVGSGANVIKGAGVLKATVASGTVATTGGTSVTATSSKGIAPDVALASATALAAATATKNAQIVVESALEDVDDAIDALVTAVAAATNVTADKTVNNSIGKATSTALAAGAISNADRLAIDTAFVGGLASAGDAAAKVAAAQAAATAVVAPLKVASAAAEKAAEESVVALTAAETAAGTADTKNTDSLDLADNVKVTNTGNTVVSATVKGNMGQVLGGAAATSSVTSTGLTELNLENANTIAATSDVLTTVNAKSTSGNVTINNATVGHTQNLNLEAVTGGTYTDTAATTVNVVSTGSTANAIVLDAQAATSIKISGTSNVTIGGTDAGTTTAVIDASGASGAGFTLDGAGTQTYTGGSGRDVVVAAAVQTKAVDAAGGTSDTLVLGATLTAEAVDAKQFSNFEVLSVQTGVTADASKFTNSTFTSVAMAGTSAATGLTAAQGNAITIGSATTPTITVTGADDLGSADDKVTVTVDNGLASVGAVTVTTPVLAGIETLNMVSNEALTMAAFAPGGLSAVNLTTSGAVGTSVSVTTNATALTGGTLTVDASTINTATTLAFDLSTGSSVVLKAGDGNNTLSGMNTVASAITAGNGNNGIEGGSAADEIVVGNGNNTIAALAGNDEITAGDGNNTITMVGAGNNTVKVGDGYNTITGGTGALTVTVGTGANTITGGTGLDTVTMGTSTAATGNLFVTTMAGTGKLDTDGDKITGFTSGADQIKLDTAAGTALNYHEATAAVADFAAADAAADAVFGGADAAIIYSFQFDATNGYLFIDAAPGAVVTDVIVLVGLTNTGFAFGDIL